MEQNLVKELESALQACVVTFLCQGKTDASISNEEGINSCVDKFVQSARQLEGYFTKYQMYTMVNHPPDLIREDITKLREELARKDAILNTLQHKVIHWDNELKNLISKQTSMLAYDVDKKT